jgi:c-di-GMP-binding flagellar brake protein YcgR
LALLFLLPALLVAIRAFRRHHLQPSQFQRRARDQGLRPAQRRLLWHLARQQRRNPVLLLRSASAFELCVGEYVRGGGKGPILAELARIRVLLGFDQLQPVQPLQSTRQLAQGQTLSLWPAGEGTDQARECLVISADEPALVVTPLAGTTPAWSPGTPLQASFQREAGAQYHFATQLLERTRHSLSLQHAEQVERLQAREFLRWDTAFPLTLLIPVRGRRKPVAGQVTNISGGGLRVETQEEVPEGTRVVVDPQHRGPFPLAGIKGRVVGASRRASRKAMHLQFVSLPRQTEAQIVRRIYRHQLRRSRGELRGPG